MDVLIAEDDVVSRRALEATLQKWGYRVIAVTNGTAAWELLRQEGGPRLAILDWMMPGLDGATLCRRVRQQQAGRPPYLILLTAKNNTEDVVAGLDAGADDYVIKPFDREELRARLQVGVRMVALQQSLADRVSELEQALVRVKQLQGLLPICSYCKRIRDDHNYWQQLEEYVTTHSEAQFSHGICPTCFDSVVQEHLAGPKELLTPPPLK
jgi:DNA-binding response OmpR family regulator